MAPEATRLPVTLSRDAEGQRIDPVQLHYIYENKKCGAVDGFRAIGAMAANADAKELAAMTAFGRALGLAFQ